MKPKRRNADTIPLADQLSAAQAQLEKLQPSLPTLARKAALGDTEARQEYRSTAQQIDGLDAEIAMLRHAMEAEQREASEQANKRRKAEQRALLERGRGKARAAYESGGELARLLKLTVEQFHITQRLAQEAVAVLPLHYPTRSGLLLAAPEWRSAVSADIARLDGVHAGSLRDIARTFPRAGGLNLDQIANPAAITPLADKIAEAWAALEQELEGRPVFPEERPTTPESPQPATAVAAPTGEPETVSLAEATLRAQVEATQQRSKFSEEAQ